jgi:Bardet-Biedl syndrome 7 protein
LHERVDSLDEGIIANLPLSKIGIKGKFSLTDAHNWISMCIPDVPQNVNQEDDATHSLYFRSTFIGTYIILELNRGSISI